MKEAKTWSRQTWRSTETDEKKFISKNNRQSGRELKTKKKQLGRLGSLSQGFKTRKTSCVWPKLEIKLNH